MPNIRGCYRHSVLMTERQDWALCDFCLPPQLATPFVPPSHASPARSGRAAGSEQGPSLAQSWVFWLAQHEDLQTL